MYIVFPLGRPGHVCIILPHSGPRCICVWTLPLVGPICIFFISPFGRI